MSDKYAKREDRAEGEVEPPLGNGDPDPPLAEPELPDEKVVVYGDASATYGSMVAPEVIRPHAGKLDEVLEPLRKRQEDERKKVEKKAEKEEPPTEKELKEELKHREEDKHKKGHR